jgi:hypothetical protein
MHARSPVLGTVLPPFLFASLLGACEGGDAPMVAQATCALVEEVALPGPVEVVAVDRGGSVHVASSSSYWVRSGAGDWAEQELSFGAPYPAYLHVAARGDELVVAHAGDGIRVARGSADAWTTLFSRPAVQCSGNPYVEQMGLMDDGSVIVESSEGLHRVREGAALESLPRADDWTVDGPGLLTASTGEALTLTDAHGSMTVPEAFDSIHHMAVASDGRALVLLGRVDDPRVWKLHRSADGTWDAAASELLSWPESPCPEDAPSGTRCEASHAFVHKAKVFATTDSFVVLVALTRNLGDLVYGCHSPAGNTGGCWVGWDGERRSEHEIYLAQGAPNAPPPMRILEGIAEMDAFSVDAARSESGDVHVVAGSTYARFGCVEATP